MPGPSHARTTWITHIHTYAEHGTHMSDLWMHPCQHTKCSHYLGLENIVSAMGHLDIYNTIHRPNKTVLKISLP